MTNYSSDDETERLIKRTDPLKSRKTIPPENEVPQEAVDSNVDPLQELRQNLYSEEHPQDPTKNDIFKRMTESLSNRKSTQQPKEVDGAEPVFGVRTAGNAPFEPADKQEPEADWNRNTVILQNGPKSDPFVQGWSRTDQSDSEDDQTDSQKDKQQEDPSFPTESRVRPRDPNDQNGDYENNFSVEPVNQKSQVSRFDDKITQVQGEKKRLPSGFDRKQQVSRYISYNPKRSTWDQFKDFSKVEKTLIIALAIAVLGVVSLIAYLFIESRQPGFGSGNRSVSELTPNATISPPRPVGLVLPGGWGFVLGSGIMVDGEWNPKTSEWLFGTEVRRVVAIPWNLQIEAVVKTFEPGDLIELEMSNGDSFPYKVLTVSEIAVDDTSILYDIRPTLAIILMKPEAEKRWVVVAEPQ